MRIEIAIVVFFASVTIASADLVKCKKPDGSLYVGPMPPENCTPVGSLRAPAAPKEGDSSWRPGDFRPTPAPTPDSGAAEAVAAKKAEIDRRRGVEALAIQSMQVKAYRNGQFFEGTVANGADFPVYDAKICIQRGKRCESLRPSTVHPGATATFLFEVIGWDVPDYRITWDVVPPGEAP